jgi:hypothetical protein
MDSPYIVSITCTVSLCILSLILPVVTWQSKDSEILKLSTALSDIIMLPLLITNSIITWHISIYQNNHFDFIGIVHVAVSNLSFILQLFATVTAWAYFLYGNIVSYKATFLLTCTSSVLTTVGIVYIYCLTNTTNKKQTII